MVNEEMETIRFINKELDTQAPQAPREIQLLPYGNITTPKGDFIADDEGIALIIADFQDQANDLVIDYEHQTLKGTEAPAAGWIKELIAKGADGLWAVVEWTKKASDYIANREYRYLSPVILVRADNKVVKLINAALTNQPNIDGMSPLSNKQEEVSNMKAILAALGLPEDATEKDAVEAINRLKEKTKANKNILKALDLQDESTNADVVGTILAMKQGYDEVKKLADEVKTLRKAAQVLEAQTVVNKAISEGKVTPAQKDWAMKYAAEDLDGFTVFALKAPIVVHTETITGKSEPSAKSLTQEQQFIINQMGIDEKIFNKYGRG
ncbi:Mu-like prophage FluMu I protein [Candidatus Magnetoovum chiemensis]|nr:Mu-like prophage FluMu I protein [Candidatus Magnetoovum chiemensis]